MKCPNCSVSLVMTERSGVEIDYCPECRGVWLDRGELDKIVERSAQNIKNNHSESFAERQRFSKDNDFHYKKKKGFLDDLFDF